MGTVQESPPLAAGTLLDGYEIAEVLDQGRFSFSYLARDSARGEVIIKEFLPQEFAVRDEGVVRAREAEDKTPLRFWLRSFLDKAVLLQKLNHPGLTRVLRQFEASGTGYYVAERIPGESLAAILERQQTLSEAQLRRLLGPVLSGLEQAHAVNLLHRDIRPENLVVRPDDSATLIDFGDLRAPIRFKSRTVFSSGTAPYAAPEEFYMAGPHGPWTDIYALGAVAYRAVCGQPPPDARSRASGTAMTPTAQAARVRCSEAFFAAIDQALNPQAEQRLQTIGALRAALSGESVAVLIGDGAAIPDTLASQGQKRRASPLPLVLGGVALAAAAGGWYWLRTPSAPAAAATSSPAAGAAASPAAAAPAAGNAAPSPAAVPEGGGELDRLAQEMMAKEKKAADAKQELAALQAQREQQTAQDARNAAKAPVGAGSGAAPATPPAAAAPAPSQAELDAAAHAKELEDELQKLRAEKDAAEEKARAAAAAASTNVATAASPAPSAAAAMAHDAEWNAWYRKATGQVKASLRYPSLALQAGEEGDVTVKVRLKRDGSVLQVNAVQRSDYPELDNEAVAVFTRIGRFAPVPSGFSPGSNEVEFNMPINFRAE